MNKNVIITSVLFFIGWVGFDLIRGKELEFGKVMGGVLIAIIVGLIIYIRQSKKQKS